MPIFHHPITHEPITEDQALEIADLRTNPQRAKEALTRYCLEEPINVPWKNEIGLVLTDLAITRSNLSLAIADLVCTRKANRELRELVRELQSKLEKTLK